MKPITLIYSLFAFLIFLSCSETAVEPSIETESIEDYSQLEVGNYWVYDWYEIDGTSGEATYRSSDSLYIRTDTLINGRQYFIKSGTFLGTPNYSVIQFDSANALYSYPDRMIFTLDSALKTTVDIPSTSPIAIGEYGLLSESETVQVPAGTFNCLNYFGTTESLDSEYPHGIRINSNHYAKHVGLVKTLTQFHSSPNDLEMRLRSFGNQFSD